MNGIHDMGGMHGFGRVAAEPDEPVFHADWERRVFGLAMTLPGGNLDAARHSIERLDPVTYLRHGYYGRWLAAIEATLAGLGIVTGDELAARLGAPTAPRAAAGRGSGGGLPAVSFLRRVERSPRFAPGDTVRTRDHQPAGHTRLPGYARRRRGTVVQAHGAMVFPDDHAHGRGENPQHLYTVRFDGRELWEATAEPRTAVHLDLFEPYLEPA